MEKEFNLSLALMDKSITSLYVVCCDNKVVLFDTNFLDLLKQYFSTYLKKDFEKKHYYQYYRSIKKESVLIEEVRDKKYTIQKVI